jgi:hypothetical protein
MVLRKLFYILMALVLSGCLKKESTTPTESYQSDAITDTEYSVLAAIVDSFQLSPTNTILIVQDSTSAGIYGLNLDSTISQTLQYVNQHIPTLTSETMVDFKLKNLSYTKIQNPAKIHPSCVLSSTTNQIYPLLSVSRVGISSDGQQALAYVGCTFAPLAGAGDYYILIQVEGKWKIIGSVLIWIS